MTVFLEENANINLSAFRTEETCWIGNVLDSLAFLDVLGRNSPIPLPPSPNGGRGIEGNGGILKIFDLGTGGGFPLLPLAIMFPDFQFTGLDSVGKKIDAIKRIVEKMNLKNVQLLTGRAEEFGHGAAHREQYDVVTVRAVAELSVLLEYAAPFVKVGGHIVAWKSVTIDQELQDSLLARAEFSCHLIDQYTYDLPSDFGKRQLLIFQKTSTLHKKYPRDVGVPKKNPLT